MGNNTLAARYFFKNCSVSIHTDGEMRISRSLKPGQKDTILDRDFTPADYPELAYVKSEFYQFLAGASSSEESMVKKMDAIGYLLCNKLGRSPATGRFYGFICANGVSDSVCLGKSLFALSIAKFCYTVCENYSRPNDAFALCYVTDSTQLLVVDGIPSHADLQPFFNLVTGPWRIHRKSSPEFTIPAQEAPHLLLISNASDDTLRNDASFRRRFVTLDFSSFWHEGHTPIDQFGHAFFDEWDKEQWHLFDNFMFYCVQEYLVNYSRNHDVFAYYRHK